MNGKELKDFIVKEVKRQETRLLSEAEETVPGRKRPKAPMDPAEAPTRVRSSDLPGPPIASSEEGGEMVELVGEEAKVFVRAYEVLMNLDLKLSKPEANVDPKIIELIAQAKRTLSAVPYENKDSDPADPDWSWRGSHGSGQKKGFKTTLADLPDRGTRKTRDSGPNWSSSNMTPEEKEEFQKTGRLPDRFGGKDDGSEDTTKSSKRPRGIEPTGFTHNQGKFEE